MAARCAPASSNAGRVAWMSGTPPAATTATYALRVVAGVGHATTTGSPASIWSCSRSAKPKARQRNDVCVWTSTFEPAVVETDHCIARAGGRSLRQDVGDIARMPLREELVHRVTRLRGWGSAGESFTTTGGQTSALSERATNASTT
jgi:hypothetical protein